MYKYYMPKKYSLKALTEINLGSTIKAIIIDWNKLNKIQNMVDRSGCFVSFDWKRT